MQKVKRITIMMMGLFVVLCVVPSDGLWSVSASPQLNVNISIGAPPPVIVKSRPTMVYLPEPGAYVAVGIPYDIFFVSGRYYYLHGNDWFWAQGYNGPWVYTAYTSLPPGLRKYRVERLHEFRAREYKTFEKQGPAFQGKHFEAEELKDNGKPGHGNDKDHDNDHGHGNNGRGR